MSWSEVPLGRGSHRFCTTRWSLVAAAGTTGAPARRALEELCGLYWPPLYAFARGRGHDPDSALDVTQGFFVDLLSRPLVQRADRERGRFRTYLQVCFANFMASQRSRATAAKRGGACDVVSIDAATAEARHGLEPVDTASPAKLFERRWARAVIAAVIERLRQEYAARDRAALFDGLKTYLQDALPTETYRRKAAELGTSEGAIKVTVHRMRQRFAELLLEEIGETLPGGSDPRAELEELLAALASS